MKAVNIEQLIFALQSPAVKKEEGEVGSRGEVEGVGKGGVEGKEGWGRGRGLGRGGKEWLRG